MPGCRLTFSPYDSSSHSDDDDHKPTVQSKPRRLLQKESVLGAVNLGFGKLVSTRAPHVVTRNGSVRGPPPGEQLSVPLSRPLSWDYTHEGPPATQLLLDTDTPLWT